MFNNNDNNQSSSSCRSVLSSLTSHFTSISTTTTSYQESDNIVSNLRNLHLRTIHSTCARDEELVESLRDGYDEKVAHVHRLERALAQVNDDIEAEKRSIDMESNDDDSQITRLIAEYPIAMDHFHENMVKRAVLSKQACREKFDVKKQQMMIENKLKYEDMQKKYEVEFKKMIDNLEKDSLRLAKLRLDFANA